MLTRLDLRGRTGAALTADLPRPGAGAGAPLDAVREILAEVRKRGDEAVREYTERFDRVVLDDLRVPSDDITDALATLPPDLRSALEAARDSIEAYHRSTVQPDATYECDGVVIRGMQRAVDRAGCYVPGGRAVYPSTVLMTAVLARVAGVPEVALCVPPASDGRIPPITAAAAAIAGVDEVYRIGGAQAIAALAYGTGSIRPVDVIVGPGNIYVALAKREVAGEGLVGVPAGFAGPSEVVVIADATTAVESAAVDVIVQAEHGPDGLAWLITWDDAVADTVTAAVERLVAAAPRRADIEATLAAGGYAVVVDTPEQAVEVANAIAPEHLELLNADPDALLPHVRHAGVVYCGPWAPASVGDYLAGPSHVLPTYGSARFASGLRVADFQRTVNAVSLDEAALRRVGPHVAAIAEAEGLAAHAEAVRLRNAGA